MLSQHEVGFLKCICKSHDGAVERYALSRSLKTRLYNLNSRIELEIKHQFCPLFLDVSVAGRACKELAGASLVLKLLVSPKNRIGKKYTEFNRRQIDCRFEPAAGQSL
jgi:hypothetical protein